MTNTRLITETVKLVSWYYENENISMLDSTIEAQVRDWYNNSEIVDSEMLAAATMAYGYYTPSVTWNELTQLRDRFFPESLELGLCGFDENSYELIMSENYSIEEIEAAQRDAMWW